MELINISDVSKRYKNGVTAIYDLDLKIKKGEFVFVIGGSGSGKSTLIKMLYREEKPTKGQIIIGGINVAKLRNSKVYKLRRRLGIVFQDYRLLPKLTVYENVAFALECIGMKGSEIRPKVLNALERVGLKEKVRSFPGELSGGEQQRVCIARAIVNEPKLLICDEPTTALDVTIQAQILELINKLKAEKNLSIIFITHDLGVVAEMADYVVVMYAGKVIEEGPVNAIFSNPSHPYTVGLLKSKPILNQYQDRLYSIPGQVPSPIGMPENCYFSERCEFCFDKCKSGQPALKLIEDGHKVACFKYEGE